MSKAEELAQGLEALANLSDMGRKRDQNDFRRLAAAHLLALEANRQMLVEALEDMNNGWEYIRSTHGDLYGVGWDRAQGKADAALEQAKELT